jgi:S-adenosylmethionine:tRNA ribosyltransferase-isomerase
MPGSPGEPASLADLTLDDLDLGFDLPRERVAQRPVEARGRSRLLVLRRADGRVGHHRFEELPGLLPRGSLLVLNNTRVMRCRLEGKKPSGGRMDILILRWVEHAGPRGRAEVLARGSGRGLKQGQAFCCGPIRGTLLERTDRGSFLMSLFSDSDEDIAGLVQRRGLMPLPPYIQRLPDDEDVARYQTVYAEHAGSIAAPTAGLHFTDEILDALRRAGTEIAFITLHVGEGTFRPIRTRSIAQHRMHHEAFTIDEGAARAVARARREGRPVLAVGTTCVRALEGVVRETGQLRAWSGSTSMFISPGYRFTVVSGMLTNFHTPRSTPLAMVMALAGIDEIRRVYRIALDSGYMFYSYGDAMLLL